MGHSSVQMTLDIYSHVLPDMQESAAQKFSDALKYSPEVIVVKIVDRHIFSIRKILLFQG
ncbi:hypothetical protein EDD64_101154 [Effusibacillus lacus]|nr:hypothetical protein EDD64_101154 [Effusibacillus lacus]